MKTLLITLMIACAAVAFADPVPTFDFDNDTCTLTVHPNGNALEGWIICIDNETDIGLYDGEAYNCDVSIAITNESEYDLSEYLDCDVATPTDSASWSSIKGMYR